MSTRKRVVLQRNAAGIRTNTMALAQPGSAVGVLASMSRVRLPPTLQAQERVVFAADWSGDLHAILPHLRANATVLAVVPVGEAELRAAVDGAGLRGCRVARAALRHGQPWPAASWPEAAGNELDWPVRRPAACPRGRLLVLQASLGAAVSQFGSSGAPMTTLDSLLEGYIPVVWRLAGVALHVRGAGLDVLRGASRALQLVRRVVLERGAEREAALLEGHGLRCRRGAPLRCDWRRPEPTTPNGEAGEAAEAVTRFRARGALGDLLAAASAVAELCAGAALLDEEYQGEVLHYVRSLAAFLAEPPVPTPTLGPRGLDDMALKALMHHWLLALPVCRADGACVRRRGYDAIRYYRRAGLDGEAEALHAWLPVTRAPLWQPVEDWVPGLRSAPVWHAGRLEARDPDIRRLVEAVESSVAGIVDDFGRIKLRVRWPPSYPVVIITCVHYLGPPGPFSFPDSRDLLEVLGDFLGRERGGRSPGDPPGP